MTITEAGEGRCRVWLEKRELEDGLVYVLGGGESSHIGGVIYNEPGKPLELIEIGSHHDPEVLIPIAKASCQRYGKPVVVTGGIHIDNATKDEIDTIINNCKELLKCI